MADLSAIGADLPSSAEIKPDVQSGKENTELFGDLQRDEHLKHTLHGVFIYLIRVVGFCFIGIFVVRVLHYVLPARWCWLTDLQLQGIDKSFFSAVLGGLISKYTKVSAKPISSESSS
jgi:hypothetical protein